MGYNRSSVFNGEAGHTHMLLCPAAQNCTLCQADLAYCVAESRCVWGYSIWTTAQQGMLRAWHECITPPKTLQPHLCCHVTLLLLLLHGLHAVCQGCHVLGPRVEQAAGQQLVVLQLATQVLPSTNLCASCVCSNRMHASQAAAEALTCGGHKWERRAKRKHCCTL